MEALKMLGVISPGVFNKDHRHQKNMIFVVHYCFTRGNYVANLAVQCKAKCTIVHVPNKIFIIPAESRRSV